jgi:hypothetical protein
MIEFYDGSPCKRCGGTSRWLSNRNCVVCSKEWRAQQKYNSTPQRKAYNQSWKLKKRYGLTIEDYNTMLASQAGCCAICKRELSNTKICVDHNHTIGTIRGLLCSRCNTGIGQFLDDVNIMQAAINYLKHETYAFGKTLLPIDRAPGSVTT